MGGDYYTCNPPARTGALQCELDARWGLSPSCASTGETVGSDSVSLEYHGGHRAGHTPAHCRNWSHRDITDEPSGGASRSA